MSAQTTQEMVLNLPTELVERIVETANRRHVLPEEVVSEVLTVSLPRYPKPPLREFVENIEGLPEPELRRKAGAMLPDKPQTRLSNLLDASKEHTLSEDEEKELDSLLNLVYENAAESAAAQWLLSNRETIVK